MQEKLERFASRKKLSASEKVFTKVLERLKELGYIDDAKILENYFEFRLKHRPVGKYLFQHTMYRHGIPLSLARQEWEKRKIDEEPLAFSILKLRSREFEGLPKVLRKQKMARLLAGKGFSPETVWGVLEKMA